MLANGIVWTWLQGLSAMRGFFSKVPVGLLADISFVIYLLSGIVASYQVCKKASSNHLAVGVKFALFAWGLSLLIMLSMVTEPSIGMATTLLVCFAGGGIAGAYLSLRSRLRRPRG
jgi:ABC-type amino acid transport system permease subunit